MLSGEAVADVLLTQRGGVGGCLPFSRGLFRVLNSTRGGPGPSSLSEQVFPANTAGFSLLASPSTQPALKLLVVTDLEALHPFGVLWRPLYLGMVDQIIHPWLLNSIWSPSLLPGEEEVK